MRLTVASAAAIKYACLHFHYAKAVPVNVIGFNVFNDSDKWCGVIAYGSGANNHIGSEYGLAIGEVLELVRVALNGEQGQGMTSKAVSLSLKMLKEECPLVKLVVSYADCDQSHLGTIYQATNWIYVGIPGKEVKGKLNSCYIVNGKKTHKKSLAWIREKYHVPLSLESVRLFADKNATEFFTQGKRKYLMPLDRKVRKKILPLALPYPKNDGWVKIDRSQFKKSQA